MRGGEERCSRREKLKTRNEEAFSVPSSPIFPSLFLMDRRRPSMLYPWRKREKFIAPERSIRNLLFVRGKLLELQQQHPRRHRHGPICQIVVTTIDRTSTTSCSSRNNNLFLRLFRSLRFDLFRYSHFLLNLSTLFRFPPDLHRFRQSLLQCL